MADDDKPTVKHPCNNCGSELRTRAIARGVCRKCAKKQPLSDERPAVWPTQGLAAPVSIEQLLRERLALAQREVARCEAALAALEAA